MWSSTTDTMEKLLATNFLLERLTVRKSLAWSLLAALLPDIWTMGGRWRSTGFVLTEREMPVPCFMLRPGERPALWATNGW
jgi:hypothetical protein